MKKHSQLLLGLVSLSLLLFWGAASADEIARLGQVMGWKSSQTLADVGAGEGEIGIPAAATVGQTGKVYLTELDEKKVKSLQKEVKRKGLKNVLVIQAAEKQTNLS